MREPLVSVIIPTYNRADLLAVTLESVISQNYQKWECLVIDDGSTDDTEIMVRSLASKDSRIKFIKRAKEHKKGPNGCRNLGLQLSQGEFIQFLDSDDLISTDKFSEQILALMKSKTGNIATCPYAFFVDSIERSKRIVGQPSYRNFNNGLELLNAFSRNNGYLPVHCYLAKRNVLLEAGKWNEDLLINQDGEYFTRVLLGNVKIVFCENALAYYRTSTGNNVSSSNSSIKLEHRIVSWKLIDETIYSKIGIRNSDYVKSAKRSIFRIIIKHHPKLIFKYINFFKSEISSYLFKDNIILKKLKKLN